MAYETIINVSKRVKDVVVIGIAGVVAVVGANVVGLTEQCPDATVTILGVTVGIKVVLDFVANWNKHKNDP